MLLKFLLLPEICQSRLRCILPGYLTGSLASDPLGENRKTFEEFLLSETSLDSRAL